MDDPSDLAMHPTWWQFKDLLLYQAGAEQSRLPRFSQLLGFHQNVLTLSSVVTVEMSEKMWRKDLHPTNA